MKEYDAYLFDFDGTLVDTTELIYQSFVYTLDRYGLRDISREMILGNIGRPLRAQLEVYFGKLDDAACEEIIRSHMAFQREIAPHHLALFPGVSETLRILKERGKKLAIVTSRMPDTVSEYGEALDIIHFFDTIITPRSVTRHKPHAEPALAALTALGSSTSDAVFIGDSSFDIDCGNAAGIDTIYTGWSLIPLAAETSKPTFVIQRFSELIDPISAP